MNNSNDIIYSNKMMNNSNDIIYSNKDSLKKLVWEIENSQGQFKLILASCNYSDLQKQIVQSLLKACSIPIQIVKLDPSINRLYSAIKEQVGGKQTSALMVLGLESVIEIENLLISANQYITHQNIITIIIVSFFGYLLALLNFT